jgi:small subunit ribosomal protein S16
MATAIRLKRGGRTHSAYYRIVVMDSRTRNQGREVEILGFHHPCARPEPVSQVDAHRALEWLKQGAQPSDTVKNVFSKLGVMKHFNDGTMPENATLVLKGAVVEDKGFNPAPKPVDKPAPKAETPEVVAEAEGGEAAADAAE